ncbi:unnamed protein product [Rotaria magnacalcarata]
MKRQQRSHRLCHQLANQRCKQFITTDESWFYLDGVQGKRFMIRGDVSSHGKTTLCFVELGAKINTNYYINNILKPFLRRDAPRSFPENGRVKWFLHQDSAPSHTPVEENDQ